MQRTIAITIALLTAAGSIGCSTISRSRYRRDTQTLLGTRKADIRRCYDDVVTADPTAKGKVKVRFTVKKKSGKISRIKVSKKSDAPEALQACVTDNLKGLVLPKPYAESGKATFTYEFGEPAADDEK